MIGQNRQSSTVAFASIRVNKQLLRARTTMPIDTHTRSCNLFFGPFMLPLEVFMGSTLATLHIHVKRRQKTNDNVWPIVLLPAAVVVALTFT